MKKFDSKTTGILSSSDLKSFKGKLIYWIFFAILALTSIISLFPAIWTILTSFKSTQEIYSEFSFFPKDMSLPTLIGRITESWAALQLGASFINTIVLSLGSLVSTIVVCGFAGYVLSKLKPKGSRVVFVLVVWTMMMPAQMRLVPNYITMLHFPFAYDFGMGISLLDTYWPMWLASAASAFNVILFKNAFDGLSQSYVEAAKIDGCSNFGIFFKIMLPLSMPVIIFVSIGALSSAWSDFFGPLLYLDQRVVTPLKIYRLQSDSGIQMNTRFMGFVFASIPPFLIFAIFQKRIMGGVNIGGVKG
mgnify:CR=1 FL=1